MKNVLFVCSQNKLRSPTAEQVFASYPGIECASAGLNHDAENPLTPDLLEWADIVFVMEKAQRAKLTARFKKHLRDQRIICLNVPETTTSWRRHWSRCSKRKSRRICPIERASLTQV